MVGGKLSFSASEAYKLLRTNVMFSLAEDEDGSRIFARNHDTTAAMQPPTAAAAIRINNVSIRRQMYEIGCVPASVRPRRN